VDQEISETANAVPASLEKPKESESKVLTYYSRIDLSFQIYRDSDKGIEAPTTKVVKRLEKVRSRTCIGSECRESL
jgi:hypothetical protein